VSALPEEKAQGRPSPKRGGQPNDKQIKLTEKNYEQTH
jgi:hypothetical protein